MSMTAPTEPLKWRKKPIEAFRWTADRDQEHDPEWIVSAIQAGKVFFRGSNSENVKLVIATRAGHMVADRGDYIIRGIQGELYPCKPDIFAATYEPADAPARDDAAELRALLQRGRQKLATYASVYPGDKELRGLLAEWDAALAATEGEEA